MYRFKDKKHREAWFLKTRGSVITAFTKHGVIIKTR